jgi:hypothetical protein
MASSLPATLFLPGTAGILPALVAADPGTGEPPALRRFAESRLNWVHPQIGHSVVVVRLVSDDAIEILTRPEWACAIEDAICLL